jgi:hypothetical protein
VKLSSFLDGKSWIWIDICAMWCGPCNWMAKKAKAFADNVTSQGLPLKTFSVITDDMSGSPSGQSAAAIWAQKYNLSPVLHCGGLAGSVLRDLVSRYALADGSSSPGYPTSVLVDEKGIIRAYHLGMDLDGFQDIVALHSGRTLTGGPWNV